MNTTANITTTNERIVDRHIQSAIFKKLENAPVIFSDGGCVTVSDLTRLMGGSGIIVSNVELHRADRLPQNIFVWSGRDRDGHPIYGQLKLHLSFNSKKIMVSAELTLLDIDPITFKAAVENNGSDSDLTVKQRLSLVENIARRSIQDLREHPADIPPVVAHLVDVADLIETLNWIE